MTEGDQMRVAIFCLEQMRQVAAIIKQPINDPGEHWEMTERYILKIDHVSKACRILEQRGWPAPFPSSAHTAAEAFVRTWQQSGKDLRDAYAHYEEALADPEHRLRGEPIGYGTMCGVEGTPGWSAMSVGSPGRGLDSVELLGKEYNLLGVHEAFMVLKQEFEVVCGW